MDITKFCCIFALSNERQALSQVKQTKNNSIMKAIFITREFNLNGITYYPYTTLSKANCTFIAKEGFFPGVNDVTAWWSTIINPITDKTADKTLEIIKKIFKDEYISYFKIYNII